MLRNPGIVDKILNAAELKPSDVAFEIGPGTGGADSFVFAKARTWIMMDHAYMYIYIYVACAPYST